jgi:phosphate transport system substrate-binding protein
MTSIARYTLNTISAGIVFFYLMGCGNPSRKSPTDTPTSGSIAIAVDETFRPVMQSQEEVFESQYPDAFLTTHYLPEGEAFKKLIQDSVRLVVASRKPNAGELSYFEQVRITPRITKIATDALAIIVNTGNPDTLLTYEQLSGILSGKTTSWKEVNRASPLSAIQVVFDDNNSSTARYVLDTFNTSKSLPPNCFAAQGSRELVEYISTNKNAIGVIGVNWISDRDDTTSLSFLSKIKVAGISPPLGASGTGEYYKPYQAYIAQGFYPLCRNVYIVSREARNGLGTGFAAFVAGDKGQRIILKSALVPATVPVRIVSVN